MPLKNRSESHRRGGRRPARGRRPRPARLLAERLESRALLSVTPALAGTALSILIAGGDTATLTYVPATGYVVNGTKIAGTVRSIVVRDDGNAGNAFTLASAIPAAAGLDSITATVGGAAGGTITLGGAITCAGTAPIRFTVATEPGTDAAITLSGDVVAGMQDVSFNGPVVLGRDVTVSTRGGEVAFADTLDGGFTLACDTNRTGGAGGQVTFAAAVGSLAPLAGLTIASGGVVQSGPAATITLDAAAKDPLSMGAATGITVHGAGTPVSLGYGGTIQNFPRHGINVAGSVAGATTLVSGFQLTGNAQAGIVVGGMGPQGSVTIAGNVITSTVPDSGSTTGILVTGGFPSPGAGGTLAIRANAISFDAGTAAAQAPTYGIVVSPSSGAVTATIGGSDGVQGDGNTITGATVGAGTTGILVMGTVPGTVVAGNDLAGCGYGVVLRNVAGLDAGAGVLGNRIDAFQPDGAVVSPHIGISLVDARGVAVGGVDAGNTVLGYPYGLVAAGDSAGTSVVGNLLTGSGYSKGYGVGVALADATGLALGAARQGNTITGTGVGIYAAGDASGSGILGNTIQDTSQGIVIEAARNLAVGAAGGGNTLEQIAPGTNPFVIGILAGGDCTGTTIRGNALTNTADTKLAPSVGLVLDGARNLAVGGGVSAAANAGNTVTGFTAGAYATGTLTGSSLQGSLFTTDPGVAAARMETGLQLVAARGLAVGDANDGTTTRGNTCARATAFAGFASGDCAGTTLVGNLLTASPFGFYATATGLSLVGNHALSNDVGVAIAGGAGGTPLLSNRIYGNRSAGIVMAAADAIGGVSAPVLTAMNHRPEHGATPWSAAGTLAGAAGRTFRIQYFATPVAIAPAGGPPQGRTPLTLVDGRDYEDVTIAGGSVALLSPTFATSAPGQGVALDDFLTATATLLSAGPGSAPLATSPFSNAVGGAGQPSPLALTFDPAAVGPGLDATNVWVAIRGSAGAGGLAGTLVTYNGPRAANRIVPFGAASDALSTPLTLADITDPASGRPTLYVTEGLGLSVYVSYGAALEPDAAAPSPADPGDPNAAVRYQQFAVTRHHPVDAGDAAILTYAASFTAPLSLASFATDGTPVEQRWGSISAATAGEVYRRLAAIQTDGGTIGTSSAVVRDAAGVVRVIGPSSFAAASPYPAAGGTASDPYATIIREASGNQAATSPDPRVDAAAGMKASSYVEVTPQWPAGRSLPIGRIAVGLGGPLSVPLATPADPGDAPPTGDGTDGPA